MNCKVCGKETENDICNKCLEDEMFRYIHLQTLAFEILVTSNHSGDNLWEESARIIERFIETADKGEDLLTQAKYVIECIRECIIENLTYYIKDDLFIILIFIKETIRRIMLKNEPMYDVWKANQDYMSALEMMVFIHKIPFSKFQSNIFSESTSQFFINAISLTRIFTIAEQNIEIINSGVIEVIPEISDVIFKPIESNETNNYFEEMLINPKYEQPEDYSINNMFLSEKLNSEGKDYDSIYELIDEHQKEVFGFQRETTHNFFNTIRMIAFNNHDNFEDWFRSPSYFNPGLFLTIMPHHFLNKFYPDEEYRNFFNTFNINNCDINKNPLQLIELRSIYRTHDFLIFGIIDLTQNTSTFEKFMLTGHNIDLFKEGYSTSKSIIAQKKMSTLLSYFIADLLASNGYDVPMESYKKHKVPRVEINKIKVNNINILSNLGDIDIIAIDKQKKKLFLIELKYYKPAKDYKDFKRDRTKIQEDEVYLKMKKREKAIKDNLADVIDYLFNERYNDYSVELILLTARPNYFALSEESGITYYTWGRIAELIKSHSL